MESVKMTNIKRPDYSIILGKGNFAALKQSDWYCKYCMQRPTTGSSTNGDYRPYGGGYCSKSPTKEHVWEHV